MKTHQGAPLRKVTNLKLRMVLTGGLAVLLALTSQAATTVSMTYTDNGTLAETGFSDTSYGTQIQNNDLIGIYKFTTSGSIPNPFYSVCLSPAGVLDRNPHTYDIIPFSTANPGINPPNWASGTVNNVVEYWGIQNASWLWNRYGMSIVNTGTDKNDRATALEFAIWSALYNSTAYGAVNDGLHWIKPNLGSGSVGQYYTDYLSALNATGGNIPLYTGNILRGEDFTQYGQQQEFLFLGSPIPEPTTFIAGALLLLPFGASAIRMFSKSKASDS